MVNGRNSQADHESKRDPHPKIWRECSRQTENLFHGQTKQKRNPTSVPKGSNSFTLDTSRPTNTRFKSDEKVKGEKGVLEEDKENGIKRGDR